jgi:preprotein translocase subunit SecD
MRSMLREERIRYRPPLTVDEQNRIVIRFSDAATRTVANTRIRAEFPDLVSRTDQQGQEFVLYYTMSELSMLQLQEYAIQQNLTTLRSRVNERSGERRPDRADLRRSTGGARVPGTFAVASWRSTLGHAVQQRVDLHAA